MQGFTIKSNARRAARRAGLDLETLDFRQDDAGLWHYAPKAVEPEPEPAPEPEPMPPACEPQAEAPTSAPTTKIDLLVSLLARPEGVTIAEVVDATGWQPHTARGRISDTSRKRALFMTYESVEGRGRVYRGRAMK